MESSGRFLRSPGYRFKHLLARLSLVYEAFWVAATPAVAVGAGILAAGLLGIPQWIGQVFGGWIHAGVLGLLLIALLWTLRLAVVRFHMPDETATRRRLESASGLSHRPLTALTDRLANSADPRTRLLWNAFQQRMISSNLQLRSGGPRPVLSYLDRFAIRAGLGVTLVIAVTVAWNEPVARLHAAVVPDFSKANIVVPASLDVWISAPAYTDQPPVLLTRLAANMAESATVMVPVNSRLLAAVSGGSGAPDLLLQRPNRADQIQRFEAIGNDSFRLELDIESSLGLAVRQTGTELGRWAISVIPDLRPDIDFVEAPSATQRDALQIRYLASDDYGIVGAKATINKLAENGTVEGDEAIEVPMPVPGVGRPEVTGRSFSDLTAHPWAGQAVRIILETTDEIGQTGLSDPLDTTLPERIFHHPVARAVVEQRKRLVADPDSKQDIAKIVMTLAVRPHQYTHDTVAFMGLKSAATRLLLNKDGSEDRSVTKLLWNVALRIEDGEIATALDRLRELERRLQEALAGDANDNKIQHLMNQLESAIGNYLRAMAEQAAKQPQQWQSGNEMLDQRDLRDMMQRMRDMAQGGARDMARDMLSQLQEMMENLRMGHPSLSPQQAAAQDLVNQLGRMAREQQSLMDRSYQQFMMDNQQRDPQSEQGDQQQQRAGQQRSRMTSAELAHLQEQLRRRLGEFMDRIGEMFDQVPGEFGQADQFMGKASGFLREARPGNAVGSQSDAVGALMDGARSLSEFGGKDGRGFTTVDGQSGGRLPGRDPFNRRRLGDGYTDTGTVGLPTKSDFQKAREIIHELQRRSGDRHRPVLELDYIDRLLRRF